MSETVCGQHQTKFVLMCSDCKKAALAAKDEEYQANLEEVRRNWDNSVDQSTKQLQAMFDREQLATKSAESLSCLVEQLKGEAGNRIVEAARLREEIVVQRRELIAKDAELSHLRALATVAKSAMVALGLGQTSVCFPITDVPAAIHAKDERIRELNGLYRMELERAERLQAELAQLRQQVEAEVWIIESGDYEQRGVDGVADSVEAAVEYIKQRYHAPYIVNWHDPVMLSECLWQLCGNIETVPNHSIQHAVAFSITRTELRRRIPAKGEGA